MAQKFGDNTPATSGDKVLFFIASDVVPRYSFSLVDVFLQAAQGWYVMHLLNEYAQAFSASLDGTQDDILSDGGASAGSTGSSVAPESR